MGRPGKLDVNIDSVRMIDGETAALSATKSEKGSGHTGAMTAGIVGTAIVFFPAAPLPLFIHGKDISIPEGAEITAFVSGNGFVGSTPSTLSVASGQHTVTMKKKGYADWSRQMKIAGNAVHLNADLTVAPQWRVSAG